MVNYQNGKIYKLESLIGGTVYYGSTTQRLSDRLSGHKKTYNRSRQLTSRDVLKYGDAKIYLVENYPCNNKEELHSREGYYIKNNECVNKQVAGRTKKEWASDNKEHISKYKKIYRNENKEKIKKQRQQYYNENKELYRQYAIDNKDKIASRQKQHYKKNKERILSYMYKQSMCECGVTTSYHHKSRHNKSKRHINYMNNTLKKAL